MRSTEVRMFVVFVVLAVGKPIKRIRWLPFRDFLETFEAPVSPGRRGLRNMEPFVLHSPIRVNRRLQRSNRRDRVEPDIRRLPAAGWRD